MNKNVLKELILPSFWLFFFIVYSKEGDNSVTLKNERDIAIKQRQDISTAAANNYTTGENKESRFTKAIYLAGF